MGLVKSVALQEGVGSEVEPAKTLRLKGTSCASEASYLPPSMPFLILLCGLQYSSYNGCQRNALWLKSNRYFSSVSRYAAISQFRSHAQ